MAQTTLERRVRKKLRQWYAQHARDLPWRATRDPYSVWVSEIMLQQTRVDTVIPYYERFLARFPTVERLAESSEEGVLQHWSGLGYYRRARLLHRGAQHVLREHGGQVPSDAAARKAIPGVGRYTAGAIGSIAFDQPEAIVDGNVKRVLARLFDQAAPVNSKAGEDAIWEHATSLAKGKDPGAFNQSMMELGALVCTPKNPDCDVCPVRKDCAARINDTVSVRPVKLARKAATIEHWSVVVPVNLRNRQVLMVKHRGARFAGLWGLPMEIGSENAIPDVRQVLAAHSLAGRSRPGAVRIQHQLTHRDMRLTVQVAVAAKMTTELEDARWIELDDHSELAVSTLTRKILRAALDMLA